MTKYVNMAPPRYKADDSKGGVLLPLLMIAGAAGVAVYTGLDPDTARVMGMQLGGNAIAWIDGFINTARVCSPTSAFYF